MTIAIVTDSTSDLSPLLLDQYGAISVPLHVFYGGETYKDNEINLSEMFASVSSGERPPTTSQPSPIEFEKIYRELVKHHTEVISIHISGELSGTVQSARIAASDPDFGKRITVIDSQTASIGLGMRVIRAAEMAQHGHSVPEIVHELEEVAKIADLRFTVDSLAYLRANGRISSSNAFLGNLLNLKPILQVKDGKVVATGRARGHKRALLDIIAHTQRYVSEYGESRIAYLLTQGGEDYVHELRAGLENFPLEDLGHYYFGTVIGAHVGPGAVGVVLEPRYLG